MSTFNPPADIAQITLARSSDVNDLKDATSIAFGLLPSETKLQRGTVNFAVDTGTANTYVVSLDSSITSYTDGLCVSFKALTSNTGSSTINVNGLGAKSIRLINGDAVQTGDIVAGVPIDLRYSTTTGFFHVASNSANYATIAIAQAAIATTKAGEASTSATNAANSASSSSTSASNASTSATNAANSASSASTSASNASASATNAAASATTATTQASNASTSASAASTFATNATASATAASGSASTASTQATNAATSATNALGYLNTFKGQYYGSLASNPTLDPLGAAMSAGDLYWNSTVNEMRVYSGSAWVTAYVSASSTGASIRPSLLLDFANSKTLDPRITFTRASTATYTGADGLIKTAASGAPRFDFNPTTGESLGLLIEEQRTNLLTYSEQFDNAAWTKSNATVTANATTAPDGTLTADKLVENTVNTQHYVMESITSSNGAYTCSVYAKAGERTIIFVGMSDGVTALSGAFFNLSTLSITPSTAGSWSATSNTIQDMGNGWYRCIVTGTRGAGTATTAQIYLALNTAGVSYTGDGTSGIYIWGAQLEAGSFATSYIPTVASQATRAADNAVMTGTNFSSWYRQDEGTVFVKFDTKYITQPSGSNGGVFVISDNTTGNRLSILKASGSSNVSAYVETNSTPQLNQVLGSLGDNTFVSTSLGYKNNDSYSTINGTGYSDSITSIPIVTNMRIGEGYPIGSWALNGHIAKLAYYPKRLTNAELQSITTV